MLSLTSKYALSALITLSKFSDKPAAISELSKLSAVPEPYLRKIIKALTKAKLLESRKGPNGGILLPAKRINFYDICLALKDPVVKSSCFLGKKECSDKTACSFHASWSKIRGSYINYIKEINFQRKKVK